MSSTWRDEQKAILKQHIYVTAMALFDQFGYEATSVRQITEKAQVAKGTFFNYFPSKDHILLAWYQEIHDPRDFERDPLQSAEESVISMSVKPAQRAVQFPHLLQAKLSMGVHTSLITAEEISQDRLFFDQVLDRLGRGKQNGELRPDLDETFFTELILTLITGLSRRWAFEKPTFDLPAAIERDLRFLFAAIRNPQGGSDVV